MFRRRRGDVAPDSVVIVGGGVGGLATALALGRSGVATTLIERDELSDPPDAEAAAVAGRRGTPQATQTHGFLSRLTVLLREELPDVLTDMEAAGGRFLSMTAHLGDPQPGDEDLAVLIIRRSTFEWILRSRAQREPNVTIRSGIGVSGLISRGVDGSGRPIVTGVRLDDGSKVAARAVVASTGARGEIVRWLSDLGVGCAERLQPIGLTYLTRWYRRSVDEVAEPRLFAHLPYMKVLAVPGDGDTISVSLAVRLGDTELRRALSDPDAFDRACDILPATQALFSGPRPMEPLTGVLPMAGLSNRARRFTDESGDPTTVGFHAVGDAHTMSNPLLGRGCALSTVQAVLLADAFRRHPDDPVGRSVAYEAACDAEILPWFENALVMGAFDAGQDPSGFVGSEVMAAAQLISALFSWGANDPILGRALARYVNLMELPSELLGRSEVVARAAELGAAQEETMTEPSSGPSREELLAHLDSRSPHQ